MSDKVRAIPLIQFMFDEYNLKIKDKPTYIFEKFKDSGYEQPKRKPLPDGVLPMTDEEKEEFINLIPWHRHYDLESIAVVDDLLTIGRSNNGIHCDYIFSHSVKAILYLANLFDLEV